MSDLIRGNTFVFTGILSNMKRSQAEDAIRMRGGYILRQVSPRVTYVVKGIRPGASKLTLADRYDIQQVTEGTFREMLATSSLALIVATEERLVPTFEDSYTVPQSWWDRPEQQIEAERNRRWVEKHTKSPAPKASAPEKKVEEPKAITSKRRFILLPSPSTE